jgi:hypothetical protein
MHCCVQVLQVKFILQLLYNHLHLPQVNITRAFVILVLPVPPF